MKELTKWEIEYNYIKGYAIEHQLRNTLKALAIAVEKHRGQTRDSGEPYIIHPLMVTKTLILLNIGTVLREWYPQKSDQWTKLQCDILYASAMLHDVIEDCYFSKEGEELVTEYYLDWEVLEVVRLLSKPKKNYIAESYFANIANNWKAGLVKLADNANNCSTLKPFNEKRKIRYIKYAQTYIYSLADKIKTKYQEFTNVVDIMKNVIVSICESLASIMGLPEMIVDNERDYLKTVAFIKGVSRTEYPNTYKALEVALEFHKHHKRTSGDPFIIHPLRVCHYLMALSIKDDVTYATALLHEIPQKSKNFRSGMRYLKKAGFDKAVLRNVEKVANKAKMLDKYYQSIEESSVAVLEKLSNRVHTCTFLASAREEDIEKYKAETMNYMVPMAERAIVRYQKYANQIEIMESHILAIFNMIASETTDKKAG